MYIPFIYVLFIAESLLIFFALSIIFGMLAYRFSNRKQITVKAEPEKHAINLGSSYIEHLDTEIMKNKARSEADKRIELDTSADSANMEKHSALLIMRDAFLTTERTAAEYADNDNQFWQGIYDGMDNVFERFKSIKLEETITANDATDQTKEVSEKVIYIETQGKKIDGEVNRLKDIIFEQENTLSDLIKALKKADDEFPDSENSAIIAEMREQVNNFERQLRDSKTCMDVLEMENNRLQSEVQKLETNASLSAESKVDDNAVVDVQTMRQMIENQEEQISSLTETIDSLKLSAEQSEKIKSTLSDFARSSRDMMSCIAILEEENERLQSSHDTAEPESSGDSQVLKTQLKKLEEELIKKDVAYAKLQDEFASIEKEYLAMYNAIHGDK